MTLEAAVEALARAMGLWRKVGDEQGGEFPADRVGWHVMSSLQAVGQFDVWRRHTKHSGRAYASDGVDCEATLTPHEAMFWLRCALLGTTRVRCPDCEGGTRWRCVWTNYVDDTELSQSECDARAESLGVPHRVARDTDDDGRSVIDVLRGDPCPTCTGPAVECKGCEGRPHTVVSDITGQALGRFATREGAVAARASGDPMYVSSFHDEHRDCSGKGTIPGKPTGHVDSPWAEVFLAARPLLEEKVFDVESVERAEQLTVSDRAEGHQPPYAYTVVSPEPGRITWTKRRGRPGDPEARTMLSVKADELQANGDPLGLWLALWLGQQPCEPCSGLGRGFDEDGSREWHCMACGDGDSRGSGLALGAHDRAMAEAGERLAVGVRKRAAFEAVADLLKEGRFIMPSPISLLEAAE